MYYFKNAAECGAKMSHQRDTKLAWNESHALCKDVLKLIVKVVLVSHNLYITPRYVIHVTRIKTGLKGILNY